MPPSAHPPTAFDERLADAARYALLRRLAPAIRHNMAGSLQPIGMISALLERRLQGAAPDLEKLGKNARDLTELSREASGTCMNLMTWLAPREREAVALHAGLAETLQLQTTELSFRGFTVVNETAAVDMLVYQTTLRSVVMACLMVLTDTANGPADVIFAAQPLRGETLLSINRVATQGAALPAGLHVYRQLSWGDVQALADAEQIVVSHTDDRVELRLPEAELKST